MSDEKKPRYAEAGRPMADAITHAVGQGGLDLWGDKPTDAEEQQAQTEIAADPKKAMLVGYLAGFETALHITLCGSGTEKLVTVLAMAMDQSIHDGETPFHQRAEDMIDKIKEAMVIQTIAEGGEVNGVTGFVVENPDAKTPEELNAEIRMGIAGVLAKVMPKKDKDDA